MATTKKEGRKVEYIDLLFFVRQYIDKKYGGVTQFFDSKDSAKCGFKQTLKERSNLQNYLSLPKHGENKKVISVPAMAKLFKGLFNLDITSKTEMQKTVYIYLNEDLKNLKARYLK